MNRLQINLLPLEILEKRKAEKIISLIVLGAAGLFAVVFLAFLYSSTLVGTEVDKLEELRAENARYEIEISKIGDFESSKIYVEERHQLVNEAVSRKYSWSKWLNNISLLIPNEVWLDSIDTKPNGDVTFSGTALADTGSRQLGQKSVAKWLVRLSELDDMTDVWLDSSTKSDGARREPAPDDPLTEEELRKRDLVNFRIKARIAPLAEDAAGVGGKT